MTSDRGAASIDKYIADLVPLLSLSTQLAAAPETSYLLTYAFDAAPAFIRAVGGVVDPVALAHMAGDPNTAIDALAFLAGVCPREFCANPALPLLLLERPSFPTDIDPASLGRLLSYDAVPEHLLRAFAQLGRPDDAMAARLHVGLAGEAADLAAIEAAIARLATIPDDDLLAVLLALGAVPDWLHRRIAVAPNPRLAAALAYAAGRSPTLDLPPAAAPPPAHVAADPARLAQLLQSEVPEERAAAAASPAITPAQLVQARHDEDWSDCHPLVYRAIAGNPSTPPELLVAFARDQSALSTGARRAVARNPSAPPEALRLLADEPHAPDIQLSLAAHPNLDPAHREQLLAGALERAFALADPFYRAVALAHPRATAAQLAAQARAPFWIERLAVALNPNTPPDARVTLASDGIGLVRAAARAGLPA